MSDTALMVLAVVAVPTVAALPLLAYAKFSEQTWALVARHGRFSGLASGQQTGRPAGLLPGTRVGALQGRTA